MRLCLVFVVPLVVHCVFVFHAVLLTEGRHLLLMGWHLLVMLASKEI